MKGDGHKFEILVFGAVVCLLPLNSAGRHCSMLFFFGLVDFV